MIPRLSVANGMVCKTNPFIDLCAANARSSFAMRFNGAGKTEVWWRVRRRAKGRGRTS